MVRRFLFVLSFIVCIALFGLCVFTIPFTGTWAVIIFIFRGDKADDLIEIVIAPLEWSLSLPWKIFNYD